MMRKHLVVCVTNDLIYDQRMQRICQSLSSKYEVTLIGRSKNGVPPKMQSIDYHLHWLPCYFTSGKLFYLEYQIRLFFYLIFRKWDGVYAVDLDTLWGGFGAASLRGKIRIYDAHEYFVELPELQGRRLSKGMWSLTAKIWISRAHLCITVNEPLAEVLSKLYGKPFLSIRNMPLKRDYSSQGSEDGKILLYQGVLNVGRGLEQMIELMPGLPDWSFWLAGEGDLSDQLRNLAFNSPAASRIKFLGYLKPNDLRKVTPQATIGLNLLKGDSGNYYYSLANKFFDFVQAGVPQISMHFPAYESFMNEVQVGILVPDLDTDTLLAAIQQLSEPEYHKSIVENCRKAAALWHWELEEVILLKSLETII